MKNDTSIDLDSTFAPKQLEQPQPQKQQEAPVAKINWNDIMTEWCYRIPKGYPTVVDGVFTEYEEVKILNKILEEKLGETIPLPEAKPAKAAETKFEKWYKTKSATWITPFLETAPIVEAMTNGPVTLQTLVTTVLGKPEFDWKPEAVEAATELKPLLKDKASVNFVDNVYLKGGVKGSPIEQKGSNLKSLNGGKPISSFIHGGVNDFYKIVNSATPGEKNKVFTADVILFWGVDNPFDPKVQDAVKKAVTKPDIQGTSLVKLGKNAYMACVSLKANVGRFGKLTAFTSRYVDVGEPVNEGFIDNVVTRFKNSPFGQLLAKGYDKLRNLFSELYTSIKEVITPSNPSVQDYIQVNNTQSELEDLINEAETADVVQEAVDGDLILCTTCMQEKIKKLKPYIDKSLQGKALNDFSKTIKQYADGQYFVTKFIDFNTVSAKIKNVLQGKKLLEDTTNLILKATPGKLKEAAGSCAPLVVKNKPLYVSRQQLKNILFANGNATSFELIDLMLKDSFKNTKAQDLKQKKEALLKLAVTLTTESVFGRSGELPLVKYTGTHLLQLGTKKDFINNQKKNLNQHFSKSSQNENGLPIIALKVTPSQGKTGDSPYYYNVQLYTLYTVEPPEVGKITSKNIRYAVIAFKCNSGSKFAFAVEGDKELGGDSLAKDLAKVD